MTVNATITITRDDENIEVELEGHVEYFGSYNPHERGYHIGDWDVVSPANIALTPDENDRAIEALEESIHDD